MVSPTPVEIHCRDQRIVFVVSHFFSRAEGMVCHRLPHLFLSIFMVETDAPPVNIMSGGLIIIINWLSDTKSCQSVRRWLAAQRHSPETKLLDWCNAISRSSCTAFWFLEFILDVKQRIVIVCRHQKIQTFSKFPVFMFEKKGPGTKNMPKELHVHCW